MKILLLGLQATLLLASFPPWQGSSPLKYCIDPSTEQYRAEIHYALLKWVPHTNLGLVETKNCQEPRTIVFRLGNCGPRLGYAFPPPPTIPEPLAGDIHLSFNVPWWLMKPLLVGLLLHEVGHALGMEESADKMDVMEPSLVPQKWDLSEREKELVRRLYQEEILHFPKGWFLVYPGSEKLNLGEKRPVACFRYYEPADKMVKEYWPGSGYIEIVE